MKMEAELLAAQDRQKEDQDAIAMLRSKLEDSRWDYSVFLRRSAILMVLLQTRSHEAPDGEPQDKPRSHDHRYGACRTVHVEWTAFVPPEFVCAPDWIRGGAHQCASQDIIGIRFGHLLRGARTVAGLTASGVSTRAVASSQ